MGNREGVAFTTQAKPGISEDVKMSDMQKLPPPFFWLHIKKSAGTTVKKLLQPHYVSTDHLYHPKNFLMADPAEYNDILNNHRVVLGDYQFKRAQFAKQYLYPTTWDSTFSFAFSREPVERCVSMFHYLFWIKNSWKRNVTRSLRKYRRYIFTTSRGFDIFLDYVEEAIESKSIFEPVDSHFTTHVNPMWKDVLDENGQLLLKKIYRTDNVVGAVNDVFAHCGIPERREPKSGTALNRNVVTSKYTPKPAQLLRIRSIYEKDFDIYEAAAHQD